MSSVVLIISITLMYSAPLILGALGGLMSERSGVVNIGIEGMMTVGAFVGAAVGYFTGNPWIGFVCAGLAGGAVGLLHAVASVTFNADQNISGIAINLLGPGISLFLCRRLFDGSTLTSPVPKKLPKVFNGAKTKIDLLQNFNIDSTVVIALVLTIVIWFILYKTKWGMRIWAVGEAPAAADTLGVSVSKVRYICVILSGVLSGLGGAAMTLAVISQFTASAISGQGYIALSAVIFGKWTPQGAYGACILFGFAQALAVVLGGGKFAVPSEFLAMLPYVVTILVLVLFVGKSVAPKADGVPYEKGAR